MYWSKLTTRGAMLGGWLGLITAVVLMILGPTIWVQILGHEKAIFPYEYPALFSISVAFLGIWFFSATDNSAEGARERELFRAQFIRSRPALALSKAAHINLSPSRSPDREYASSPTCITFSHNIKQINSLKNERFLTVVENDNAENMPFLSC